MTIRVRSPCIIVFAEVLDRESIYPFIILTEKCLEEP